MNLPRERHLRQVEHVSICPVTGRKCLEVTLACSWIAFRRCQCVHANSYLCRSQPPQLPAGRNCCQVLCDGIEPKSQDNDTAGGRRSRTPPLTNASRKDALPPIPADSSAVSASTRVKSLGTSRSPRLNSRHDPRRGDEILLRGAMRVDPRPRVNASEIVNENLGNVLG